MKFIAIASSKIKAGDVVFTQDADGKQGVGKLVLKEEVPSGTTYTFEQPQFFDANAPMIKPVNVSNITHVCKIATTKEVKVEEATSAG